MSEVLRLADYNGDARSQAVADMLRLALDAAPGRQLAVVVLGAMTDEGVLIDVDAAGVDALQAVGLLELAKRQFQEAPDG